VGARVPDRGHLPAAPDDPDLVAAELDDAQPLVGELVERAGIVQSR
jgi:hypothetical protein